MYKDRGIVWLRDITRLTLTKIPIYHEKTVTISVRFIYFCG